MAWYEIIKKIGGRSYLYKQRTYREGGRVRSQSQYIGPVSDVSNSGPMGETSTRHNPFKGMNADEANRRLTYADLHPIDTIVSTAQKRDEDDQDGDHEFSNPFLNAEVNQTAAGLSPLSDGNGLRSKAFKPHYKTINDKEGRARRNTAAPKSRKEDNALDDFDEENWKPGNPFAHASAQKPEIHIQKRKDNPFGGRVISLAALEAEYRRATYQLTKLGLDGSQIARIKLIEGKKAKWRKVSGRSKQSAYKVYLAPGARGSSGRNQFKRNYRLALAHAILDGIEAQSPAKYEAIRNSIDHSWTNTKLLVAARILTSNAKDRKNKNRFWLAMCFAWSGALPSALDKKLSNGAFGKAVLNNDRSGKSGSGQKLKPLSWRDDAAELMAETMQRGYKTTQANLKKEVNRSKANARRTFKEYQALGRIERVTATGRKKWKNYKRHEAAYLVSSQRQSRFKMLAPFLSNFHEK